MFTVVNKRGKIERFQTFLRENAVVFRNNNTTTINNKHIL